MTDTSALERRSRAFLVLAIAALVLAAWTLGVSPTSAAPAPATESVSMPAFHASPDLIHQTGEGGAIFVKYDGVDGESKDENHDTWIDVLNVDWGAAREGTPVAASRRRGAAEIQDLVLTFDYEKASPKLEEALFTGKVFPKVEIEFTGTYGGARATYLRIEMKNVLVTSYDFHGMADGGPPTVAFGNNFEEIKVTYTEYDDEGNNKGNVEYSWKVEKGES